MDKYIIPKINENSFTCPHCGVLASINWSKIYINKDFRGNYFFSENYSNSDKFTVSTCEACGKYHLWLNDKMLLPITSNVPMPNDDMPENVKNIYLEARVVYPHSAKAAAALLRLAVQELCIVLGCKGKKIDDDIKYLVQEGLSVKIQQALDSIRVIGNNAVHPGTIDLNDNPEMTALLFQFINVIVNDMITQPKSIETLYSQLPSGALDAIQRRDGK